MEPVNKSRWLTAVLVVVVFVLGALTGGFATRAMQQRRLRDIMMGDPAATRTRLTLLALDRRLELTAVQRAEAERLLRAQEEQYRAAVEPCRPRVRELRRDMASQLGSVLEPKQREALEEFIREGERGERDR